MFCQRKHSLTSVLKCKDRNMTNMTKFRPKLISPSYARSSHRDGAKTLARAARCAAAKFAAVTHTKTDGCRVRC